MAAGVVHRFLQSLRDVGLAPLDSERPTETGELPPQSEPTTLLNNSTESFDLIVKTPRTGWDFRNDFKNASKDEFAILRKYLKCGPLAPGETLTDGLVSLGGPTPLLTAHFLGILYWSVHDHVDQVMRGAFEISSTHVRFGLTSSAVTKLASVDLDPKVLKTHF